MLERYSGHMRQRVHGFSPVIDSSARILILGSMPSEESIRRGEYYGHPRNRFWPLMEALFGIPVISTYALRLNMLTKARIGLWDVLDSCDRMGSLDVDIVSETYHDFGAFLGAYPGIAAILCNGSKAYGSLLRATSAMKMTERFLGLRLLRLPSTSPANAAYSMARLMMAWSNAFGYGFAEGVDVLLHLREND